MGEVEQARSLAGGGQGAEGGGCAEAQLCVLQAVGELKPLMPGFYPQRFWLMAWVGLDPQCF